MTPGHLSADWAPGREVPVTSAPGSAPSSRELLLGRGLPSSQGWVREAGRAVSPLTPHFIREEASQQTPQRLPSASVDSDGTPGQRPLWGGVPRLGTCEGGGAAWRAPRHLPSRGRSGPRPAQLSRAGRRDRVRCSL